MGRVAPVVATGTSSSSSEAAAEKKQTSALGSSASTLQTMEKKHGTEYSRCDVVAAGNALWVDVAVLAGPDGEASAPGCVEDCSNAAPVVEVTFRDPTPWYATPLVAGTENSPEVPV